MKFKLLLEKEQSNLKKKEKDLIKHYVREIQKYPRYYFTTCQRLPHIQVYELVPQKYSIGGGPKKSTPSGIFAYPMAYKENKEHFLKNWVSYFLYGDKKSLDKIYPRREFYFILLKLDEKYEDKIIWSDTYSEDRLQKHLYNFFKQFSPKDLASIYASMVLLFHKEMEGIDYSWIKIDNKFFGKNISRKEKFKKLVKYISEMDLKQFVKWYIDNFKNTFNTHYSGVEINFFILWETLKMVYYKGVTSSIPPKSYMKWNEAFKKLGILGAVDLGKSIIHEAEIAQAVFFDVRVVDPVYYFEPLIYFN